jgi:hypothetical protein
MEPYFRESVTLSIYLIYLSIYLANETESTWYCGNYWPIVPAPDDRWWWLWSNWWNKNWQWKPKYSEKICPCTTLSTTNPTGPDLKYITLRFLELVIAKFVLRIGNNLGPTSVGSNRRDQNPSKSLHKVLHSKAETINSVTYATNPFITETSGQGWLLHAHHTERRERRVVRRRYYR